MRDELFLCERDLGWIDAEEESVLNTPWVVTPMAVSPADGAGGASSGDGAQSGGDRPQLSLETLRGQAGARTLVIDLEGMGNAEDPLAALPPPADVDATVRARLRKDVSPSIPRLAGATKRCVLRLLDAAAATQ